VINGTPSKPVTAPYGNKNGDRKNDDVINAIGTTITNLTPLGDMYGK